MTSIRRFGWAVPVALGALTLTVAIAVVMARREQPSRALLVAAPTILDEGQGTPPEIAALNAQLAQIAALHADATYGVGLTKVVRGPAPLRPALGEEWRELGRGVGHVLVRPMGKRSPYFEASAVVVAPHGPGRLAILTSEGQRTIEAVGINPYQVVNFGPLLSPAPGPIGLALTSLQPHRSSVGPSLVLSPLQVEYLAPGEWVKGMPALAEAGPGGLRGLYVKDGSSIPFAMTPGIGGRCEIMLNGASIGGALRVTITAGSEARSATLSRGPAAIRIGPFLHSSSVVTLAVRGASNSTGELFISDLRFLATLRG